jgi:hypothetical protein
LNGRCTTVAAYSPPNGVSVGTGVPVGCGVRVAVGGAGVRVALGVIGDGGTVLDGVGGIGVSDAVGGIGVSVGGRVGTGVLTGAGESKQMKLITNSVSLKSDTRYPSSVSSRPDVPSKSSQTSTV